MSSRVLGIIFGPKRDKVMEGWRKLHYEELHNLNCSPNIIRKIKSRRMRWAEHVARLGGKRNAHRILVGEPEGNRPLGRGTPGCYYLVAGEPDVSLCALNVWGPAISTEGILLLFTSKDSFKLLFYRFRGALSI
jgi:hypothetical protein